MNMDLLSIDENQLDRSAHQQLLRQRHQITKSSKVLLKCYPSSLISDYDDKRCCDKIIILSKTRKKKQHHSSHSKMNKMSMMYWKNILVFSVIVLINLATKECIAARQLEGMLFPKMYFIHYIKYSHSMMMISYLLAARHFNLI
jgi:hypothetical protein